MSKSEEMLRLERDLNEHPELREKLEAETKRIAEAGEAESDGEVMVKATTALGYTITLEELERSNADLEKLDDEELNAAGGSWSDQEDEKGHDGACLTAWHCYVATLHSDTESTVVSCWKNYLCFYAYHEETRKSPKERIMRR
ncbi:MAG: hypothetical protein IKH57_12200 [Clostridia bacterium]|nr:hypothetical protein [Clostridia bacterium]